MNKVFITLMICLAARFTIFAQEDRTFTVKAGESILDVLTMEEIYRYPDFIRGKVLYKNGNYFETVLNYNNVLGEMQFISNRSDTMIITNADELSIICLAEDTFYVSDGYLEKIAGNKNIFLLEKNYVKLKDIRQQGPYGASSSTSAIDNYISNSSGDNTSTYMLVSNQDIIYSFKIEYYLGSGESHFVQAKRNALLKLYPEYKNDIKDFIKEQSISFNRRQDLIRLTEYLQNLVK